MIGIFEHVFHILFDTLFVVVVVVVVDLSWNHEVDFWQPSNLCQIHRRSFFLLLSSSLSDSFLILP